MPALTATTNREKDRERERKRGRERGVEREGHRQAGKKSLLFFQIAYNDGEQVHPAAGTVTRCASHSPLPLPLLSFFNVTLEVISGESRGELGGTAGSQADQQPILFVLLLLVFPLPVTRKILFRLTFTTGPKGESFSSPTPTPTLSLSMSFSPCMKTLISFCFWAFCLLLFVSMSPSKLFCYLFCLTRFFTGCCLCLLG